MVVRDEVQKKKTAYKLYIQTKSQQSKEEYKEGQPKDKAEKILDEINKILESY